MKRLAVCFAILLAAGGLQAAATATLSTDLGGVFDDVGVGTRPLGMGGADTAVADDANAAEDNPAGMGFFNASDRYATFSHSDLFGLGFLSRDFVAYAQGDQGYSAVGVSFNQLSVNLNPGEWAEDEFEYSGAKQVYGFADDDLVKIAVGWQAKYLRVSSDLSQDADGTSVGGGDATGWGTGFGALMKVGPKFSLGLMAQDLYSTLTWSTGNIEEIPTTIKEGAAYRPDKVTLLSAEVREQQGSDVQDPDGMALSSWHVGGERWFFDGESAHLGIVKNVGFRAGYYQEIQNSDSGVLTAGASVKADVWELDYTYEFALGSDTLGDTQRFGLGLKF